MLAAQRARYRPLRADEQGHAIVVDTSQPYTLPAALVTDRAT
jgi:hypothetical protein